MHLEKLGTQVLKNDVFYSDSGNMDAAAKPIGMYSRRIHKENVNF